MCRLLDCIVDEGNHIYAMMILSPSPAALVVVIICGIEMQRTQLRPRTAATLSEAEAEAMVMVRSEEREMPRVKAVPPSMDRRARKVSHHPPSSIQLHPPSSILQDGQTVHVSHRLPVASKIQKIFFLSRTRNMRRGVSSMLFAGRRNGVICRQHTPSMLRMRQQEYRR